MNLEFKINKELSTLNVALAQWHHLNRILRTEITEGEFSDLYGRMYQSLLPTFEIVIASLKPVYSLDSEAQFSSQFSDVAAEYGSSYLAQASKPRHACESCHDYYIELSTHKLTKTSFPILKRNFSALYEYIDKLVTNDAWIIMSSDIVLKYTQKLLLELGKLNSQDQESAWLLYQSIAHTIQPTLVSLESQLSS